MKAKDRCYYICCRCDGLVPFFAEKEEMEIEGHRVFQHRSVNLRAAMTGMEPLPVVVSLWVSYEGGSFCEECKREYLEK